MIFLKNIKKKSKTYQKKSALINFFLLIKNYQQKKHCSKYFKIHRKSYLNNARWNRYELRAMRKSSRSLGVYTHQLLLWVWICRAEGALTKTARCWVLLPGVYAMWSFTIAVWWHRWPTCRSTRKNLRAEIYLKTEVQQRSYHEFLAWGLYHG